MQNLNKCDKSMNATNLKDELRGIFSHSNQLTPISLREELEISSMVEVSFQNGSYDFECYQITKPGDDNE